MGEELIYLDTYILQQDMRVRMPKCIVENMNAQKGKTRFAIYYDKLHNSLILKPSDNDEEKKEAKK